MIQVRDGAAETLGVLFDRYHVPIFNFYAKLTGDRSTSEDLVQEVFLRILRYRQSYQNGTPFRAWIYQIARNARIDQLRKKRPQTELDPETLSAPPQPDLAQQDQDVRLLHRALMSLPEEKREILILSRFQELKHHEIARLLGCEPATVRVRVHRALQALRENFQRLTAPPAVRASNAAADGPIPPRRSQ